MREMSRLTDGLLGALNPVVPVVGYFAPEADWCGRVISAVQQDFDLWCVLDGRGEVRIDGVWHQFSAGDLVAMKPGQEFQQERTSEGCAFRLYYAHMLPFGAGEPHYSSILADMWPLIMPMQHRPELSDSFERLFVAHTTRTSDYSPAVKGSALLALHVILEELRLGPGEGRPRTHPRALEARAFIQRNYSADIGLSDIAEVCGLSPTHLCVVFREHFGRSPIDYLLHVRIREAKVRLGMGHSVKETANAVGFHSQHYFARLFRRRTGMAPTEFAARLARF